MCFSRGSFAESSRAEGLKIYRWSKHFFIGPVSIATNVVVFPEAVGPSSAPDEGKRGNGSGG